MKRIGYLLLGVFTVAAVSACEARQSKVDEKLDAILTRLDKLEQNLRESREPVDNHQIELEDKLAQRIRVEEELLQARVVVLPHGA